MTCPAILSTWNDRYFEGKLPEPFLDALATLPIDRQDVLDFVERFFPFIPIAASGPPFHHYQCGRPDETGSRVGHGRSS